MRDFNDDDGEAASSTCFCFGNSSKHHKEAFRPRSPALEAGAPATPALPNTPGPLALLDLRMHSYASDSYTPDRGSPATGPSRLRGASANAPRTSASSSQLATTVRPSPSGPLDDLLSSRASREGSWLSRSFVRSFRAVDTVIGRMRRRRQAEDGTGRGSQFGGNEAGGGDGGSSVPGSPILRLGLSPSGLPPARSPSLLGSASPRFPAQRTREQLPPPLPPLMPAPLLLPPSPPLSGEVQAEPVLRPSQRQQSFPNTPLARPLPPPQAGCWDRLMRRRVPDRSERLDAAKIAELCKEISAAAAATVAAAAAATAAATAATAAAKSAEAQCLATMAAAASFQRTSGASPSPVVSTSLKGSPLAHSASTAGGGGERERVAIALPTMDRPAAAPAQFRPDVESPRPSRGRLLDRMPTPHPQGGDASPGMLPSPAVFSSIGTNSSHEVPDAVFERDRTSPQGMLWRQPSDGDDYRRVAPRPPQRQRRSPFANPWLPSTESLVEGVGSGGAAPTTVRRKNSDRPVGCTARSASVGKLDLYRNLTLRLEALGGGAGHSGPWSPGRHSVETLSHLDSPSPASVASPTRRGMRFTVAADVALAMYNFASPSGNRHSCDPSSRARVRYSAEDSPDASAPGRRWSVGSQLLDIHGWDSAFQGQGEDVRRELQRVFSRDPAAPLLGAPAHETHSGLLHAAAASRPDRAASGQHAGAVAALVHQSGSSAKLSAPQPLLRQQGGEGGGGNAAAATRIAAVAAIGQQRLTAHILSHLNSGHRRSGSGNGNSGAAERHAAARHNFRRPAETGSPLHSSIGSTASESLFSLPLTQAPVAGYARGMAAEGGGGRNSPVSSRDGPERSLASGCARGASLLQRCVAAAGGGSFSRGAHGRGGGGGGGNGGPWPTAGSSPTAPLPAAVPPPAVARGGLFSSTSLMRASSISTSGLSYPAAPAGPALLIVPSYGSFSVTRSHGSLTRMGAAAPRGHLAHRAAVISFGGGVPAAAWGNDENAAPPDCLSPGKASQQSSFSDMGSCPGSPRSPGARSFGNSDRGNNVVRAETSAF